MDKQQTNQKPNYSLLSPFTWWKLDPIELEKQVSGYASLKIYISYRGIAVLLITGWVLLTKFFSIIHWLPNNKFVISLFIYEDIGIFSLLFYLLFTLLIYKGKKWAIIVMMLDLTINSGFALLNSIFSGSMDIIFWAMIVFWWALFMRFLYGAFKVEQLRNNVRKSAPNIADTVKDQRQSFLKQKSNFKPLLILKENKKKVLLILLGLLLLTSWFYWFQWRPSEIKHNCSWIKHYEEAIPERPALNEDELKAKGLLKDCSYIKNDIQFYGQFSEFNQRRLEVCENGNKEIIEDYKTIKPAKSAKEWYTKATEEEYKFCLHDKGLK